MASTYSDRLRIELIGTGEQSGTWGNTTNTNLGTLIEEAIAGVASITMTDANYTLTVADGSTDESRQAVLVMSGTLSTTRNVICPAEEKVYIIKNSTTGGQSIVLKTSGGTGITVPNGATMLVFCDGTNVLSGQDAAASWSVSGNATVGGTLTVDGATSLDDSVVINESGADKDFRVEGDTDTNLLFTDASADAVGIGTNTPGAKLNIVANTSGDAVRITQTGAGNALVVEDSANPDSTPFVIDTDGRVVAGYNTSLQFQASYYLAEFLGTGQNYPLAAGYSGASSTGPRFTLVKNRSSDWSSQTVVSSGDTLGELDYQGSDGANYISAARISSQVDATPGTNDMPGRLVFSTTADGASSPTERMRITNVGSVGIGTTPTTGVSFQLAKTLTGGTTTYGINHNGQVQSDSTLAVYGIRNVSTTAAASFTLASYVHFTATQGNLGANSAITTQYGFLAENTLTGATNNIGFYSNIASGTGRWNFFANGTADNYFAGNVGIGAVPGVPLDVTANSGAIAYRVRGRSSDNIADIQFTDNAASTAYANIRTPSSNTLTFITANVERLRIDGSGNVGIGTSSPNTKLSFGTGTIGSANEPNVVRLYDTGTASTSYGFGVASGTLTVASGGTTVFARSGSESMRIDSSGNVGIGTSSPSQKIDVVAANNSTSGPYSASFQTTYDRQANLASRRILLTADNFRSTIQAQLLGGSWTANDLLLNPDGGNVGIGTSSPDINLRVAGTFASIGTKDGTVDNRLAATSGGAAGIVGTYSNNSLAVYTNASERMRIDSSGNVGIGNTNPSQKLDISATSAGIQVYGTTGNSDLYLKTSGSAGTFSGLYFSSPSTFALGAVVYDYGGNSLVFKANTSERMRIDSSGRVGIKTSSPAVELDVNGAVRVNAGASYQYYGASGGADQKVWDALSANDSGNALFFRAVNDAYSASYSWLSVSRSGYQPQTITFYTGAGTERLSIDVNGFTKVTGSFGRGAPVTKTGNFTLAATENWIICNGTGSITVTLPAASSWTGRELTIKTVAAQTVVSASSNVVPLAGGSAGTAILAATAGKFATLVSDGTNWVIMASN